MNRVAGDKLNKDVKKYYLVLMPITIILVYSLSLLILNPVSSEQVKLSTQNREI